jgi:hypothetical protein
MYPDFTGAEITLLLTYLAIWCYFKKKRKSVIKQVKR